ncbi:hypothetical protein PHYC_03379 [Phycisphaerales bacterium]|nr:hypothetical protein PHYC_03379 [Phycisphaerales bacterium]
MIPRDLPNLLAHATLPDPLAGAIGAHRLILRRAWPRDENRLLLEYATPQGRIVAAQWAGDQRVLARVLGQTAAAAPHAVVGITRAGSERILVQPGGADREIPALAHFLRDQPATLISHRVERRAVALGPDGRFIKFTRSDSHTRAAMEMGRRVWALPRRRFDVPELLDCIPAEGRLAWSALSGHSWRECITQGRSSDVSRDVGHALRELHDATPETAGIPVHDAAAEARVLRRWVRNALDYALISQADADSCDDLLSDLARGPVPYCLIHRDFHERQVLISLAGRVGIIDFDTLSIGEPALDLGNVLAHLDLAAKQNAASPAALAQHASAFLDGYGPSRELLRRAAAYRATSALRLKCLHTFRPRPQTAPDASERCPTAARNTPAPTAP